MINYTKTFAKRLLKKCQNNEKFTKNFKKTAFAHRFEQKI
ncbi:hypothetical protein AO376_1140 [Moraxella catarrhalis]|nr:hypothetical protein AO376_1140 [Moraxella catarrhalis]